MTRATLFLALAALLVAGRATAAPDVVFHGNQALLDPVLRHAMELPSSARATASTAALAETNLRRFFRTTGYDLAQVHAVVQEGVLHVFVDEGRLERVVVHGQSSWKTVQVKLDLRLPGDVYNRLQIEQELVRLKERYGLADLRAEVRDSGAPEGAAPTQLGQLSAVPVELLWTREQSRYELHLFSASDDWGDGWGIGLALESPDGLVVDASWSDDALVFTNDRYRLDSRAGGWLREPLAGGRLHPVLTRAGQSVRWLTPPLIGDWLRLDATGVADVRNVQRADLSVDAAWRYGLEAGLGASFEPFPGVELGGAGGYRLDGVSQVASIAGGPPLGDTSRAHGFLRASLTAARPDPSLRLDRRDVARLVVDDAGIFQGDHALRVLFDATGVLERSWNELILRLRGAWVGGPGATWWDDVDVAGDAFRVPPPGLAYARRLAQVAVEGRLSLHRDFFKVGAFVDGSVHERAALAGVASRRGLALAFGASLHALVLDAFELDAYLGGVLDEDVQLGQGVMVLFRKVY